MAAAAVVQPRLSPAAVSPHFCVGGAASGPVNLRTTANLVVAARTTDRRTRRHAKSNEPTAIRTAKALLPRGTAIAAAVSPGTIEEGDQCSELNRMNQWINRIKAMLRSIGDGLINIAAYDTAWVALVPDLHGEGGPQFPSSLRWVEENQLADGSWGDPDVGMAYDRLLNTLACVIALKSWGICPDGCQRGISFLRENMHRLGEEDEEQMPCGFEVVFPSLIEKARSLDLGVPCDHVPALRDICARRDLKLERIPKDVVHKVPTSLLYSLEGITGLDWEKLLRLQCDDGSFLSSPSSTAFALMQTGDAKCFSYLEKIVQRFNGGVPDFYPLDLFERLWAVDRLERLGISRFFPEEMDQCLDYVHKCWTECGIGWARNSRMKDVDDTAMAFRLLRLHGYDVSSDVFGCFEKNGEFFCLAGELKPAITHIFNLNRASQVSFPGEKILEEARIFSCRFLRERKAQDKLSDKWIIAKDLAGEVGYALDFPWYASLPRVETRLYLEQYGGARDVWISKTLYRMPPVSNDDYLELAKSDYRQCQALHQLECLGLQRWYAECGLEWHGVSRMSLLRSYFLAAASIFEPERAAERLSWAQTAVLAEAVLMHFRGGDGGACFLNEMEQALSIHADDATAWRRPVPGLGSRERGKGLVGALLFTLDHLSFDVAATAPPGGAQAAATQCQILQHLQRAWKDWVMAWREEEEERSHGVRGWWPGGSDNEETSLLLVRSLELCAGRTGLEESLQEDPSQHPRQLGLGQRPDHQYAQPARLLSSLCRKLRHLHQHSPREIHWEGDQRNSSTGEGGAGGDANSPGDVESDMRELTMHALRNPSGGSRSILQTFLTIAKSFYYVATCPPATLEYHIAKVLWEEPV